MTHATDASAYLNARAPMPFVVSGTQDGQETRRSTRLVAGPVQQTIGARAVKHYWGRFQAGDLLRVEIRQDRARDLRIEIVDDEFRGRGLLQAGERACALEVRIERAGVSHVQIRNLRDSAGEYALTLRIQRALPPASGARDIPFGQALLCRVRRAAGLL